MDALWVHSATAQFGVGSGAGSMVMSADQFSGVVKVGVALLIYDSPSSSTYVALACDSNGRLSLDDVLGHLRPTCS